MLSPISWRQSESDELQVNRLLDAPFFSLMADECTSIATVLELSLFCRWVENISPMEHFMRILSLKKGNVLDLTVISCLVDVTLQL